MTRCASESVCKGVELVARLRGCRREGSVVVVVALDGELVVGLPAYERALQPGFSLRRDYGESDKSCEQQQEWAHVRDSAKEMRLARP